MNDNTAITVCFGLVITLVLGFSFIISDYNKDENAKVVEMLKAGVDPLALMCATDDTMNSEPKCIILAMKK